MPAHETFVAEAEPVDSGYTVVVVQAEDDGADYIIQAGAEPTAGHDPACERRGSKNSFLPPSLEDPPPQREILSWLRVARDRGRVRRRE